jgi:PBP1b-binding outer membrane lipoprotein LpoB
MNNVMATRRSYDRWNTTALAGVAVIAFLMIWLNACSSNPQSNTSSAAATPASASSVNTTGASVPTSLANAGEYGENVYDYAKAKDWKNAEVKLAALKDAVKNVSTDVKSQSAAVNRLDTNVSALDRAVTAKNQQATMREANQVTLDVADMTTAYKLSVPVEVTKLDYYGRELEVWAQAKDANKLQVTARDMRQTWDNLRPSIETHSATEAKKFDTLVAQVESAKTPAASAQVATPVLNEVDNLEKLFQ